MSKKFLMAFMLTMLAGALPAAESGGLPKVAKALGLPENASEDQVLKAIQNMKNAPAPKSIESRVGEKLGQPTASHWCVTQPTLGASQKPGTWYGRGETLFLYREDLGSQPYVMSTANNTTVMSSDDYNMGYEPAARLTLGYQWTNETSFELTYFGLEQWRGSSNEFDSGGNLDPSDHTLVELTDDDTFTDVERYTAIIRSRLHSGEANVRHQISPIGKFVPTFSVGLRYLYLNEKYSLLAEDELGDFPDETGIFHVETTNNMIGLQGGLELTHQFNDWASIGVKGQAGILANFVKTDTMIRDRQSDVFNGRESTGHVGITGLVAAGVQATFHPQKHIDVHIGYDAYFLAGVAMADRQGIDGPSLARVNAGSSLLYHGPSFGFTLKW